MGFFQLLLQQLLDGVLEILALWSELSSKHQSAANVECRTPESMSRCAVVQLLPVVESSTWALTTTKPLREVVSTNFPAQKTSRIAAVTICQGSRLSKTLT